MQGILAVILLFVFSIFHQTAMATSLAQLEAEGFGASQEAAQALSLSSLVSRLNEAGKVYRCENRSSLSKGESCLDSYFFLDIALKGVRYEPIANSPQAFGIRATLDRLTVKQNYLPMLTAALENIRLDLGVANKASNGDKSAKQAAKRLWQNLLIVESTSTLLGVYGIDYPKLPETQSEQIRQLQTENADTLASWSELPERLLALGDVYKGYLHAPIPAGSVEMTPFSEAIRHTIESDFSARYPNENVRVRGIKKLRQASSNPCYDAIRNYEITCPAAPSSSSADEGPALTSVLVGRYESLDDETLLLYYAFENIDGTLIDHVHLKFPLSLTKDLRHEPINRLFDQTLHQSIAPGSDLHVELVSTRGKRSIMIYGGESIGLKIKASQPVYFYVVGHVMRETEQFSYLIEMGTERNPFVGRVTEARVGQWIDLGEFVVEQPFGVEHLQLVASSADFSNRIPASKFDAYSGYHVIEGSRANAMAGLERVRGMQRTCTSATTRGMQRNCSTVIEVTSSADSSPAQAPATSSTNTVQKQSQVAAEHESILSFTSMPPYE